MSSAVVDSYFQNNSLRNDQQQVYRQFLDGLNEFATKGETAKNHEAETDKNKYRCEFCNESFKRKDRLDRHIFTHTKKKLFICDFEGCSKEYTNNSHLNRHKKSHGPKPELATIICQHPGCLQGFTNSYSLKRHYQTRHLNPFPLSCSQCDEKFRRKKQLKKHEIKAHTGRYPHTCSYCDKGFLYAVTLQQHLRSHKTENKNKQCQDCSQIFRNWSLLVEHRRKMHKEQSFCCDLCDKTFYRKPNIKEHMRVHLLPVAFQCHYDKCPKFYTAKRNLMAHIRSKHEGRRWTCDSCQREFSSMQKLQQHVQACVDPDRSKRLLKKRSAMSRLVGLDLPQETENKIMNNIAVDVASLPLPDSTTDFSDC